MGIRTTANERARSRRETYAEGQVATTRRRWFWTLLGVVLVATGTIVALLSWRSPSELRAPSCLFHRLTGLYCPGCGSTRAVRALLRGRFVESLRFNPTTAPALALVAVLGVQFFRDLWRGEFPYRRGSATATKILLAAILVFFALRNVPLPAFDVLRPPRASALPLLPVVFSIELRNRTARPRRKRREKRGRTVSPMRGGFFSFYRDADEKKHGGTSDSQHRDRSLNITRNAKRSGRASIRMFLARRKRPANVVAFVDLRKFNEQSAR